MYLSISLRVHFFLAQPSTTKMCFVCFVVVSASSMMCFSSSPTHGLDALKVQARLRKSSVLFFAQNKTPHLTVLGIRCGSGETCNCFLCVVCCVVASGNHNLCSD